MKIAVDAMGGDKAPHCVVAGAREALAESPFIERLYLTGDEATVKAEMDRQGFNHPKIEIVHAPETVGMEEEAVKSVRRKKKSSISIAIDLVKHGDCEAVVSAGNTGAAVASTSIKLRTLPGVERAGIATTLPNEFGPCNIIDAGANVDAKPQHLLQYAIMGTVYAEHVQGKKNPVVGLMSVGEEDSKGNSFTKEVFAILKDSPLNFKGNVEGHDLFESPIDVVVCDGFIGNVVLKSCEATAKVMFKWLKHELNVSPFRQMGALMAKGAFIATLEKGNSENYGGSPLLGVNGICIIAHGSSSPLAIKNAIRVAAESVRHEVNPHIEDKIQKYGLIG